MNGIFDIDYKRLVRLLLLFVFRYLVIIALLDALAAPVMVLYDLFRKNREANLYRLSITPQVFSLEKMLNDMFDSEQRRIYIGDGVYKGVMYIYTQPENKDLYIYLNSESKDLYIYPENQDGANNTDFVVYVPASLLNREKDIHANLMAYRLASKTFKINFI